MLNIDMWYGDKPTETEKIDITFYPNDAEYRGNIYKNGKVIGDYSCSDSVELEKILNICISIGDNNALPVERINGIY